MASRGRREALGLKAFRDLLDPKVFQDRMELTVRTVLLDRQVFRDSQGHRAFRVRLGLLVRWGLLVLLVTLVFRVFRAALDLLAVVVSLVYPDPSDPLVP